MSVTTEFDERIERAKELMSQAYKELVGALDEDVWGHNDMKSDYIDGLHEVASELLKLKRKL